MAKTRIRRKDLKQPDEFVHVGQRVLAWSQTHRRTLVQVAALVAGLLLVIGIYNGYRSANLRRANELLAQGLVAFRSNEWDRAADTFTRVATEWPNTPAGRIAVLLASAADLHAQQHERASARLGTADKISEPSPYLEQQLLLTRSFTLEHAGNYPEAAAVAERAAKLAGPYAATALYESARLHLRAGNTGKAGELIERLKKDHGSAPEAQWATALLASGNAH
ncbi:MAG: tetratricopeptide repeat protein [Candidatus Binatia bacterium]|nr:tetratricopeptide repeat protein [Candidatus Binatia bacterium]